MDDQNSYYPRWKCKIVVYLEDYAKKVYDGAAPPKAAKNLKGTKDERVPLIRALDPLAPPGVRRFILLESKAPAKAGGPQEQILDQALAFTFEGIIPHEFNVSRNNIRTADTLTMSIRFIELPIDPRTVRAAGVTFFLGTVSAEEHADGLRTGEGSMLPNYWTDSKGRRRSNERFTGFVDKWTVDWTDSGEPMAQLECRDNTQLIIDTEVPPELALDAKKPIDEAITDYLAHFPQMLGMSVEWRGSYEGEVPPTLDSILSKTAYRPELGPSPTKGGGSSGEKLSVWDFLTDVASSIGHAIWVDGNIVVIQRTKSLYSAKPGSTARPDDPFEGRDGNPYRRWFYGRNILSMKTARNYQRVPMNIEVRCYLPSRKKVVVARYPPDDKKQVEPKGGGVEQKWKVWRVSGVKDEKTLQQIAQNVYEMQGRNELEVGFKTKNLASFGGGNSEPDVLDMRPGDSFELFVARDDEMESANSLMQAEAALIVMGRGAAFLKSLGFPDEFATTYTRIYHDAGFQTAFKAKMVTYSGNINEGVNIEVTGINYIEVRADKNDMKKGLEAEAGGSDDPVTADKPLDSKVKKPGPPPDGPAPTATTSATGKTTTSVPNTSTAAKSSSDNVSTATPTKASDSTATGPVFGLFKGFKF